jgi:uncharacterized protein YprB with RNaseH-like and TPR domain
MIEATFSILEGIGPATERRLWEAGIRRWADFLGAATVPGLSLARKRTLDERLAQYQAALDARDARFFARSVPLREHWRLFERFQGSAVYLDIETTGLSAYGSEVTVVGLYDGYDFAALVSGVDLTEGRLAQALGDADLLVTYFGSAFDVPFLRHHFPGVDFDLPHIDLCFAGRRVGLTGGLKSVERQLGLSRPDEIAEVDGWEAVRLWHAHERGVPGALDRLLAYNEVDVRNLAVLAPVVYQRLRGQVTGEAAP